MTTDYSINTFTAFAGEQCIGTGPIETVALLAKAQSEAHPEMTILFFDDATGRELDLDLRGSEAEVLERLAGQFVQTAKEVRSAEHELRQPVARGRPKLGVVSREVTLLPRHWDWLNSQPGSASVALRKLVDEARRTHAERDELQRSQKATFIFISAMAGNREYFEEAIRALFAGEKRRFLQFIESWPVDIRRHAIRLSASAFSDNSNSV